MEVVRKSQIQHYKIYQTYYPAISAATNFDYYLCKVVLDYSDGYENVVDADTYYEAFLIYKEISEPDFLYVCWFWGYDMSYWDESEQKLGELTMVRNAHEEWERKKMHKGCVRLWMNKLSEDSPNRILKYYYEKIANLVVQWEARCMYIHDDFIQVDDQKFYIDSNRLFMNPQQLDFHMQQ